MVNQQHKPNRWAFIAPLLAFMLLGILYPTFDQAMPDSTEPSSAVVIDQVQSIEVQAIKLSSPLVSLLVFAKLTSHNSP